MTRDSNDAALHLALRTLTCHRAALHHDRRARVAEVALAHWARTHNLRLLPAARSQHPHAKALRAQRDHATRARRHRDRFQTRLAATRATDMRAIRANLAMARRLVDDPRANALLDSLARDLRRTR